MKKLLLAVLITLVFVGNAFSNNNCRRSQANERRDWASPPHVQECRHEKGRRGRNWQWEEKPRVCADSRIGGSSGKNWLVPGHTNPIAVEFNPGRHIWIHGVHDNVGRCWRAKCLAGAINSNNPLECSLCNDPGDHLAEVHDGVNVCVKLPITNSVNMQEIRGCRGDWVRFFTPDGKHLFCVPNCPANFMVHTQTDITFNLFRMPSGNDGNPLFGVP